MVLAMTALTVFVIAMIASYAGAFAKPTLHHLTVAVAAPEQVVDAVRGRDALAISMVGDDAAAQQLVRERVADSAFVVAPDGEMTIYVAGGGGRSVATAAETVGREIAARGGSMPRCAISRRRRPRTRRAPLSSTRSSSSPSGRHWAPPRSVTWGQGAQAHQVSVAHADADGLLGLARRCGDRLRRRRARRVARAYLGGLRCAVALRVGRRRCPSPVGPAFGAAASMVLTLFLVVVGNAAAAGPVGRPLLSGFCSTFSMIVPQGSGVALLRSISYFGGNGPRLRSSRCCFGVRRVVCSQCTRRYRA